ncbi:MAG: tetratricopeptide repeat protein [Chitinivibrionales bacterium]|nr:tetratricopeptide repeat protein [Chitinivibrionales bacterium]
MARESSIDVLEKRLTANPASRAFPRLADSYRKRGDIEQAITVCNTGLQAHPSSVTGLIIRGRCYVEKGKFSEAIENFTSVLSIDRHNHLAIKMLADIFSKQGMEEKSSGLNQLLLFFDPDNGSVKANVSGAGGVAPKSVFAILGIKPQASEENVAGGMQDTIGRTADVSVMESAPVLTSESSSTVDLEELGIVAHKTEDVFEVEETVDDIASKQFPLVNGADIKARMDMLFGNPEEEKGGSAGKGAAAPSPDLGSEPVRETVSEGDLMPVSPAPAEEKGVTEESGLEHVPYGPEIPPEAPSNTGVPSGIDISRRIEALFGAPPEAPSAGLLPEKEPSGADLWDASLVKDKSVSEKGAMGSETVAMSGKIVQDEFSFPVPQDAPERSMSELPENMAETVVINRGAFLEMPLTETIPVAPAPKAEEDASETVILDHGALLDTPSTNIAPAETAPEQAETTIETVMLDRGVLLETPPADVPVDGPPVPAETTAETVIINRNTLLDMPETDMARTESVFVPEETTAETVIINQSALLETPVAEAPPPESEFVPQETTAETVILNRSALLNTPPAETIPADAAVAPPEITAETVLINHDALPQAGTETENIDSVLPLSKATAETIIMSRDTLFNMAATKNIDAGLPSLEEDEEIFPAAEAAPEKTTDEEHVPPQPALGGDDISARLQEMFSDESPADPMVASHETQILSPPDVATKPEDTGQTPALQEMEASAVGEIPEDEDGLEEAGGQGFYTLQGASADGRSHDEELLDKLDTVEVEAPLLEEAPQELRETTFVQDEKAFVPPETIDALGDTLPGKFYSPSQAGVQDPLTITTPAAEIPDDEEVADATQSGFYTMSGGPAQEKGTSEPLLDELDTVEVKQTIDEPFIDTHSDEGIMAAAQTTLLAANPEQEMPPEQKAAERAAFTITEQVSEGQEPGEARTYSIPDHVLTPTLADIYYQQGQVKLALQVYDRLLQADPDNEKLRNRIAQIKAIAAAADANLLVSQRVVKTKKTRGASSRLRAGVEDPSGAKPLAGVRIKKKYRQQIQKKRSQSKDAQNK